jgi:hypothetical protein
MLDRAPARGDGGRQHDEHENEPEPRQHAQDSECGTARGTELKRVHRNGHLLADPVRRSSRRVQTSNSATTACSATAGPAIVLALLLGVSASGEGTSLGPFLGVALLVV